MKKHAKKVWRKPRSILLFYQFYFLQSCSLQFSDAYFYLLHFVYPYIPSLRFLGVWIFEMPSRYISSLIYSIQFHYVCRFHSWNNKLCSMWWNINFAGLWCILKTLMVSLLMYLSQKAQDFKITPVLFCPSFFFSFFYDTYLHDT